jgi:pilus assembly protein Flp/PilA
MTKYLLMLNHLIAQRKDERGATAVEYGLLVALIAAVIILAVVTLGQQVLAAFNDVSSEMPASS